MYTFVIDPKRKLIRSWIEGFLTTQEVEEWSREEQAAVVTLGCKSGEFLLLVDTSRCAIQSQEVVALFQHIIANSTYKSRRIAIMQGGSLTKMQTRRIVAGNDHIRHFAATDEAEAWLFADEPVSAPNRIGLAR
jgi:hypothetical protein